MKLTVLVENTCCHENLQAEHGLSLYLEHNGNYYLLDAGRTEKFSLNAPHLNCDLSAIDAAVLSHGHYDHADGFVTLFEQNKTVKVYARSAIFEPQYAEENRYIGLEPRLKELYADRFDLSDEQRMIAPGLWLVPDTVNHEQSLVAETDLGLVVMNSCCHAGGAAIVEDILNRFPGRRVYALVGGLHLMSSGGVSTLGVTPDEVRALVRRLVDELGVEMIYTGHCTGSPAFALMQETSPEHIRYIHTGDVIHF